jgi:hypothetical protein
VTNGRTARPAKNPSVAGSIYANDSGAAKARQYICQDSQALALGYFDDETCRLGPIENPFAAKVLPMARNEVLSKRPEWTVLGALATLNGLAREGRVGKRGLPKNPIQFVATGRIYTKHGVYDAAVPIPIQKGLAATLGPLAEALGYRGVYDRYLR